MNSVLMTNINFFSIMKQKLTFDPYRNKTKEIHSDNARIKKSLWSPPLMTLVILFEKQRAVSGLSAKIQDSVNAQLFIWTQFL